jgi:superfamily II DNA/RNA helicase
LPYNLQTELATQIYAECEKLVPNECVTLVGGIALVKQKRLLSTKRPSVIVATPGRLWAMVSQRKLSLSLLRGLGRRKRIVGASIFLLAVTETLYN